MAAAAHATLHESAQPRRLSLPSRRMVGRVLAFALTGVFAVLFVTQGSLGDAVAAARTLSPAALAVAVAAVLVGSVLSAFRFGSLLRAAGVEAPFGRVLAAYLAGSAANNVLPARGGDLVRIQAVREIAPVPAFAVVGTMMAERLLDGFVLSLWIVLGALATGAGAPMLPAGLALVAGSGTGLALASLAAASPARAEAVLARVTRALPPRAGRAVSSAGAGFISGLAVFRSRRLFGQALVASLGIWLADVALYAGLARGFGLDLSLGGAFLLEGIGNLALAVPATAAGIGSFDYLTLVGARSLGLSGAAASAYVVAVHAVIVLPVTALGLVVLRRALPSAFGRREHVPAAG